MFYIHPYLLVESIFAIIILLVNMWCVCLLASCVLNICLEFYEMVARVLQYCKTIIYWWPNTPVLANIDITTCLHTGAANKNVHIVKIYVTWLLWLDGVDQCITFWINSSYLNIHKSIINTYKFNKYIDLQYRT